MLVTVYMPTKNRVQSLARAVDSVLGQTYPKIELIVVSDGSTDGTAAFLEARAARDPRLRYFLKPVSEGAPAARNLAIQQASGEFVTGLDDDDAFTPNRIQAFVEYWRLLTGLGLRPAGLYAQDIVMSGDEVRFISQKKGLLRADDLFEFNAIGNQIFAPKAHFLEAGLFDPSLPAWQDLELFIRMLRRFGTAHLLDCATQVYDDTPKPDRISVKAEGRIREAYRQVVARHATASPRNAQKLYFHLFSRYYGVRPTVRDWVDFMRLGLWPRGLLKLMLRTVRP